MPKCQYNQCEARGFFKNGFCSKHKPKCEICGKDIIRTLDFKFHPQCLKEFRRSQEHGNQKTLGEIKKELKAEGKLNNAPCSPELKIQETKAV